ncbi:MAG: transcription-repair coupling factor [Defluviitaleaceae bacterium]|nr:transcription-repair coupling factor [Defluviitaleaceae bacterium]
MSNSLTTHGLYEPLSTLRAFRLATEGNMGAVSPLLLSGMMDSQKCHIIAAIKELKGNASLVITHSELKAKEIYEDLSFFIKGDNNLFLYPAKDVVFYAADVKSSLIIKERFAAINALLKGERPVIVLSVEALFDRLSPPDVFEEHIIRLKTGDTYDISTLVKKLVLMGYERRDMVEAAGQFSMRGGILDVFTAIYENPMRIEFFDDEIDSIRVIDMESQRSISKWEAMEIFPMKELVYDEYTLTKALKKIESEFEKTLKSYEKKGLYEESAQLKHSVGEVIEQLKIDKNSRDIDRFIQYFYEKGISLLNYLPSDAYIFFDESARLSERSETAFEEFSQSVQGRLLKGYLLPEQANMIYSYSQIVSMCAKFPQIIMNSMVSTIREFKPKEMASFAVKGSVSFQNRIDLLAPDINYLKSNGYSIVMLSGSRVRGERIVAELVENSISAKFFERSSQVELSPDYVSVISGSLARGFMYDDIKLAFISDKELFGEKKKVRKYKKDKNTRKIDSFMELKVGDYIVHENHGIGKFAGIENIVSDQIKRDYIKLTYADGGNLYIPTSQMDMIGKYIGGESASPKMSRLGGADWAKAKSRAKGAVEILAKDLIELYAKREAAQGFRYGKDTVWQQEFEETFPFDETDDQLNAIEDVKGDMESIKVMDRLICGDVGYGKTEIALRAAFKAVSDGKQVAYLVPTTILAQQHYNTFTQRMQDFPISIEMMSRFRSQKELKAAADGLHKGSVDIVIGTHRILSKDVSFKNLGLVIVDEEQRFGVSHKEKLKSFKENVDVITLTATPIPRTLHMSLAGIRDMSLLDEPPSERKPIQTYVMEYNQEFIKDAIHRELARGGQVYYLYNRVRSISDMAARVQNLVPEANVAYAHGQMSEKELESIMMDFINSDINVLVCTTIIETGLDIPNVNTIIIHDSDTYGLAQLYQLRGRVGRSSRIAYCYLMYRKDKVLTEGAEKRLQTIRDFTEFGSGFKISMRDLEIRGAGNLLGESQHGHMDSVGYDMYCRLLSEEVSRLKGIMPEEIFETYIDLEFTAYIPADYISNEEQRLEIYKKISLIRDKNDYLDVQEELLDRFGDLPKAVMNLMDIAYMKAKANKVGVISITEKGAEKGKNIIITFKNDAQADPVKIMELCQKEHHLSFTVANNPFITYRLKGELAADDIEALTEVFDGIGV